MTKSQTNSATSAANLEEAKKPRKDYTSLKAWQRGHELNLEAAQILVEYSADLDTKPWCDDLQKSLRNCCIHLMEAYRRFPAWDKQRQYENALSDISTAQYLAFLGHEIGLWDLTDFMPKLQDFYNLTSATLSHFLGSIGKSSTGKDLPDKNNQSGTKSVLDKEGQTE